MCRIVDDGKLGYDGDPTPPWDWIGMSRSWQTAQSRSYSGSLSGRMYSCASGGTGWISTPPRKPCSLIHLTSSMASSMSFMKIWPMPARRSGNRSQKSTNQRLCAWMPANRCS